MTRKEAIEHGKEQLEVFGGEHAEFIKLAIEVLEQQPCDDCVSRAEAMTEIQMNARRYTMAKEFGGTGQVEWSDYLISIKDALDILRKLPPITPTCKKGEEEL